MILIASGLLILLGGFFIFLASLGVYRMPDVYLKCHTSSKAATLAKLLVFGGLALFFANATVSFRALFVVLFFFVTIPVGTHLIARAAYFAKAKKSDECRVDEYGADVF